MSLWWLQPGWGDARCHCGRNIRASGGDPDWGECYEHFSERDERQRQELAEAALYAEMERQAYEELERQVAEHEAGEAS